MDKKIESINNDLQKFLKKVSNSELVTILRYLSDIYYNSDTNRVTDETYDQLIDHLRKIDPNNKYFTEVGAPVDNKDKVKLPFSMGSLNKIKPGSPLHSIDNWLNKYKGPFIISDKLDGMSLQLFKGKDGKVSLFSRGNGIEGKLINNLIPYIFKNIDFKNVPTEISIRGELVMKKTVFEKYKTEFKNMRNLVAGVVNSDKYTPRCDDVDFVAYNILSPEYLYEDQLKKLKNMNFNVVVHKTVQKDDSEIFTETLKRYYIERREHSEYIIDGIVVVDNSKIYSLTSGNPSHMAAFKMDDAGQNSAIVKVKEIIWQISMYGYLNPIIRIDPVELSGVTITNITGNNAKYIYDSKLGKNAEIKIIRSGDVIPKIIQVIKPADKPDMPTYKTKWTETKVDLIVDETTPEIKKEIACSQNVHFFQTIKVQYISDGVIRKLYDNKYKTVLDILTADKDDLVEINGIGEKLVDKIFYQINKQMSVVELQVLMAASTLFGRGMGSRKLKSIIQAYPDIMEIEFDSDNDCIDQMLKVEGIGNIQAAQFCNNLPKFKEFYNKLIKIYSFSQFKKSKKKDKKNKKLDGLNIVISGFRDSDLEKKIEDSGGSVKNSVSKNTDIVIYKKGNETTSKYLKAKELGIKLVTEDEFNLNHL
jgi:DNA ligase (NAD+)